MWLEYLLSRAIYQVSAFSGRHDTYYQVLHYYFALKQLVSNGAELSAADYQFRGTKSRSSVG